MDPLICLATFSKLKILANLLHAGTNRLWWDVQVLGPNRQVIISSLQALQRYQSGESVRSVGRVLGASSVPQSRLWTAELGNPLLKTRCSSQHHFHLLAGLPFIQSAHSPSHCHICWRRQYSFVLGYFLCFLTCVCFRHLVLIRLVRYLPAG